MTTRSATRRATRKFVKTVKMNSKTAMKRLQSTFATKLRKANYLSISVMRLKLAELNWLKLTLPKHSVFRN